MELYDIAKAMAAPGKGLLAADESLKTAKKRLESVGAEDTEENRRMYREIFFTAEGIGDYLAGIILFDETFRQNDSDGMPFVKLLESKGVMPGIKVDMSTKPMPGHGEEVFTQGLDGLAERLKEYASGGAKFTKWRSVIRIGENMPSDMNITENAVAMAHYAAAVQAAGMVPIVEPEVLLEGNHTIEQAEEVTTKTLQRVFEELKNYAVDLGGVVLKSSMVLAGDGAATPSTPEEVAEATLRTFKAVVPEEVPSIVFLSGGQTPDQATDNLRAIAQKNTGPWQISFSYARALQGPSLEIWRGKDETIPEAQAEFLKRLQLTSAAQRGE